MQKRGEKANQKCRRTEKVEKRERERGDENPNPNSSFETPCHSVDIPLELTSPLALFLQFPVSLPEDPLSCSLLLVLIFIKHMRKYILELREKCFTSNLPLSYG